MSGLDLRLPRAPIVEAVLDIECDLPPAQEIETLEGPARNCFRDEYPKFQTQFIQEHKFEAKVDAPPKVSVRRGIQAFRFLAEDEKQLVQVRTQGFSFNRLAPYSSLDAYLPEIERTWRLYVSLAKPVQIRLIRLRYINRLRLPAVGDELDLERYLKIGPRLPDEDNLMFVGFLNQHAAVEAETGNEINIVLSSQPRENDVLPVIFDITAAKAEAMEPENWPFILSRIQSLRKLKNRVFEDTLTEQCLKLFQ